MFRFVVIVAILMMTVTCAHAQYVTAKALSTSNVLTVPNFKSTSTGGMVYEVGLIADAPPHGRITYSYTLPRTETSAWMLDKETDFMGSKWTKQVNLAACAALHHIEMEYWPLRFPVKPMFFYEQWNWNLAFSNGTKEEKIKVEEDKRVSFLGVGGVYRQMLKPMLWFNLKAAYMGVLKSTDGTYFDASVIYSEPLKYFAALGYQNRQSTMLLEHIGECQTRISGPYFQVGWMF